MNILELHNYFRAERKLKLFALSDVLCHYAAIDAKWMARRQWPNLWNMRKREVELLTLGFTVVNATIAVGDNTDVVMKHLLNDRVRSDKIFDNYTYIGYGSFRTNYTYWTVWYGK